MPSFFTMRHADGTLSDRELWAEILTPSEMPPERPTMPPAVRARLRAWRATHGQTRVLGGPGSGNFGHAGRPGEVGGSAAADITDVGITAARPGVPSREVFQHMHEFEQRLTHLPGVHDAVIAPGVGAWQGGAEPTWVVHYHGDGAATKLLAETGKRYNQDAVLVMHGTARTEDSSPLTEWAFTRGLSGAQRDAIGRVLTEHGMSGWTWFKSEGKPVLRSVAVPQWGGNAETHTRESQAISRALNQAGLSHAMQIVPVHVDVMERSGDHSYDTVLGVTS